MTSYPTPESTELLRPDFVLVDGALRSGWQIELRGDRIAAVTPSEGPVNLPNRVVLPGFVNAHSHAFQRGLRGHVQWRHGADDFWTWRQSMYSLANELDPEGVEAVSALAFLEMVLAGYTTVGEFHYLHHQPGGAPYADPDELARRVIAAARRVGLRICLLRVAYARAGAGRPAEPHQLRFVDADPEACLAATARLSGAGDPAVSAGIAPHSVRAVPGDWLRALSAWPGIVHAHVAEQPGELSQCAAEHGCGPLEVFERSGLLTDRFTAVHLTFPGEDDPARLRASGARVCACPTTELDLGDGFLPMERLDGVGVCIGSDSHAIIDPFSEIRSLELHSRAVLGRRNVLSPLGEPDGLALRLLDAGARQGARALGLDAGEIRAGAFADLIALRLDDPAFAGARLLPALAMCGQPRQVSEVWVGGQRVVQEGVHPLRAPIVAAAERVLREL